MRNTIFTGYQGNNHIQGIAADTKNGFIYYSFTTKLIKAKLDTGEIVGSVDGLVGHLGCIVFNSEDGRVYGSLEFKNDSIGRNIRKKSGVDIQFDDAFYIAVFDVDKIDRLNMDAETDGVMTAAYLPEVVDDFKAKVSCGGKILDHRFGCSGIDGTACGPVPGQEGENFLFVAYGIYGDVSRSDNDYQVILRFSFDKLNLAAKPVSQRNMHKSAVNSESRYFVFTGNTVYGVQNLEYDAFTKSYIMAVYPGKKKEYPNYCMFMIDACAAPKTEMLNGLGFEGEVLTLKKDGEGVNGIYGRYFPFGSTGIFANGDGTYLISEPSSSVKGECSYIKEYKYSSENGFTYND